MRHTRSWQDWVPLAALAAFLVQPCLAEAVDKDRQPDHVEASLPPLPFIENRGQAAPEVAYYMQTFAGGAAVLSDGSLVYGLDSHARDSDRATRLTESFVSGTAAPVGAEPAPTRVSYFVGPNPSAWQASLPTYSSLSLGEVWEGITVELHARGRNFEKYFQLEPGADPRRIRIATPEAVALEVAETGELVVHTSAGEYRMTAPVAWQPAAGGAEPVQVRYEVAGLTYGFALAGLDRTRPLIIDPLLSATYFGTPYADEIRAMTLDPATGDVLVAGQQSDGPEKVPGAPPDNQAQPWTLADFVFIARLSADLTTVRAVAYYGKDAFGGTEVESIAYSASSDTVYIAGAVRGDIPARLPGTAGGAQEVPGAESNLGVYDGFIASFPGDLGGIGQGTYFGGTNDCGTSDRERILDIGINPSSGDVYAVGETCATDLPGVAGAAQADPEGVLTPAFVARFNAGLTTLRRATYVGSCTARTVGFAASGAVYVAGGSRSSGCSNLKSTGGAFQPVEPYASSFVSILSEDLSSFVRSSYLGTTDPAVPTYNKITEIHDLVVASSGDLYVVGTSNDVALIGTTGAFQPQPAGGGCDLSVCGDLFVSSMSGDLTVLRRSTFYGGSAGEYTTTHRIARGASGSEVVVSGTTESADLPSTSSGVFSVRTGSFASFVARLSADLSAAPQGTYVSNTGQSRGLAVNAATGDIYVSGQTGSSALPVTAGALQPSRRGAAEGFIARFDNTLGAAGGGAGGADLSVALADSPDPVDTGADFTVTATVANGGPDDATDIQVNFATQAGVNPVLPLPAGCGASGNNVICVLATLASSASADVALPLTAPMAPGTVTTSVTVSSAAADPDPSDNQASESTAVVAPPATTADLGIEFINNPINVEAGTDFALTLQVENLGPDSASNVEATLLLSTTTSPFVRSDNGRCSAPTGIIRCALGVLPAGQTTAEAITLTAPSLAGQLRAEGSVTADENDPVSGNNTAERLTRIVLPNIAISDSIGAAEDLRLPFGAVSIASPPVLATVTITNFDFDARTILTSGSLDPPFRLVDPTACFGRTLVNGESCTLEVEFDPSTTGSYSDSFDVVVGLFRATIEVSGQGGEAVADLSIAQSVALPDPVDNPGSIGVGETVDIVLTVRNDGPDPAAAEAQSVLPAGLAFDSSFTASGSYSSSTGTWSVGTLAPGQTGQLSIRATVPAFAPACAVLTSSVGFPGGALAVDPVTPNNSSTLELGLPQCADRALDVAIVDSLVQDGFRVVAEVSFIYTVTNRGPTRVTDIEVTTAGTVPDFNDFGVPSRRAVRGGFAALPPQVSCEPTRLSLAFEARKCMIASLAPGESVRIERVIGASSSDSELEASGSLEASTGDPDSSNDSDLAGATYLGDGAPNVGSAFCFIATAAYGSYLEPEVLLLRRFRDEWLLTNRPGSALVAFYYRHSPPLADLIARHEGLRALARAGLAPLVYSIKYPVAAVFMWAMLAAFLATGWRRRRLTRESR